MGKEDFKMPMVYIWWDSIFWGNCLNIFNGLHSIIKFIGVSFVELKIVAMASAQDGEHKISSNEKVICKQKLLYKILSNSKIEHLNGKLY